MFKLYDVIVNKKELNNIPKGSRGTILIIYEDGKNYEVEFIDNENNSIDVLTVSELDIEQWKGNG